MKKEQYLEILRNVGLTDHEARVYFSMISLGPSTILKISKSAEIKRTTTYSVIESLMKKGLAKIEVHGFKKLFSAETPEKIDGIIEKRRDQLKTKLKDFLGIYNQGGEETLIKIYEGADATKQIYNSLIQDIKPGEDYLIISDIKKAYDFDNDFFVALRERRSKLPIKVRVLLNDRESKEAQKFYEFQKNFNLKAKFLPPNTKLTINMVVTPERLVIHQLDEPITAIVIENKSTIKAHQEMFEVMWNSLED